MDRATEAGRHFRQTTLEGYLASPELAELKAALSRGERPDACGVCWRDEAAGGWSVRRVGPEGVAAYEEVHLKISNVCNLSCRTCAPTSSSSWVAEEARADLKLHAPARVVDLKRDGVLDSLWPVLERTRKLRVTGGEPLLSPGFLALLDGLEARGLPERLELSVITNLTSLSFRGVDFVERFRRYPNFFAILSADGAGSAIEYARSGLSWPRFVEHLDRVRHWPGVIHCVVHVYSLLSIPDLVLAAWRAGKRVHYAVPFNDLLSVQLLGPQERALVLDRYEPACDELLAQGVPRDAISDMWRATVGLMHRRTLDQAAAGRFKRYTEELDRRRKTRFADTFPQLASWYAGLPEVTEGSRSSPER